jgi:hypothetical protein
VGEWKGKDLPDLSDEEIRRAGIAGCLLRRYDNPRSGAALTFFLVCGRPGQIAVHTPDVCYAGAGYEMTSQQARQIAPSDRRVPTASAWVGRFRKVGASAPSFMRIIWSWATPGAEWKAPDNPRLAYAGERALYKLYVIRDLTTPDEGLEDDAGVQFLRQFLPALDKALSPPA